MNHNEFRSPGREYRGVTLWMLNDVLEHDVLRQQIRGFSDAGWGALITRTFNGLGTQYLSEDWHECIRVIIDECRKVGLRVWLQAGYMPAGVPGLAPEDQHMMLRRRAGDETVGPHREQGEFLLFEGRAASYTAQRSEFVLDLLNPQACRRYVAGSYTDTLLAHYGEHLGKTVETVWVDEPHFQPPSLPWSDLVPDRFRALWGYDIIPELPAVFGDEGDRFRVSHHYWRTVSTMLVESYFAEVRSWCDEHGLKFSGHLMGEDTLHAQVQWTAGCMPCYESMGLPGIDHLTRSRYWPAELPFIMTPKQCSSAANQLGKPEILAEVYGVSSQGLTFQDRKRIGDWMMMLGINYRCFHGSFYSMRGERKRIYAPHLSYQQPWWPRNRSEADYFARLSYLMRSGSYAADVLVLHPLESAYAIYDATAVENPYERVDEPPVLRALTELFVGVSDALLTAHRDFEYGDETMMTRYGLVDEGLRIGRMRYRAVVLPGITTLRASTLDLLTAFLDAGGTILAVGDLPDRIDGERDERAAGFVRRLRRVGTTPAELSAALDDIAPLQERLVGPRAGELWVHRRDTDLGRLIVLHSPRAEDTIHATLVADGEVGFELWDTGSGERRALHVTHEAGATSLDLTIASGATVALLCREAAGSADRELPVRQTAGASVQRVELGETFELTRHDPNALLLDFCRFRRGDDAWSSRIPVRAVQEILVAEEYRGPVTLEYSFRADEAPSRAQLAVEDGDLAGVTVNGTTVSFSRDSWFRDRAFLTADISHTITAGDNRIELFREFDPPTEPKFRLGALFHTSRAVELEAIAVIGDFAVRGAVSDKEPRPRAVRYRPEFSIAAEAASTAGDLVASGYPFYAGTATLSAELDAPARSGHERAYLTLPALDAAVAAVRVNGTDIGTIGWHPLEIDITTALQPGKNRIDIELAGTLRNLLGPHHRPSGEPDQVWRDGWTGLSGPRRRDTTLVSGPDWYRRRESDDVSWTDDYFFVPFGLPRGVAVEIRTNGGAA